MSLLFFSLLNYLFGSLSTALILARWNQLPDPRGHGSGNPGASNILRLGHRWLALTVLLGDSLKAILPLWLAKATGFAPFELIWLLLFICLGHIFPIFFKFKGGKGVATAFGGLCVISWPLALLALMIWLCVFFIFRYSSIAALSAALGTLSVTFYLHSLAFSGPFSLLVLLLIIRHSANIKRIFKGNEYKIL